MFNFFKKKPVAIIQISRLTATEENTSVTVNAYKLDRKDIYKAMQEAGEALRLRLIENNLVAQRCMTEEVKEDNVQDTSEFKKSKVKK
jgi:hypothetical protein